jgi:hypothetical protein
LRLAGWRLWYDPRLKLRHFVPAGRLNWGYLRRLHRGFGAATVGHDPYFFALGANGTAKPKSEWFGKMWKWAAFRTLQDLRRQAFKFHRSLWSELEGDGEVLEIESQIGRLSELIRKRNKYDLDIRNVCEAKWRH